MFQPNKLEMLFLQGYNEMMMGFGYAVGPAYGAGLYEVIFILVYC